MFQLLRLNYNKIQHDVCKMFQVLKTIIQLAKPAFFGLEFKIGI